MGRINMDALRFVREIKRDLPNTGRRNRAFLNQIQENVKVYLAENQNADYHAITERFGTPQQIISSYVQEMDTQEISNGMRCRNIVIGIVISVAVLILLSWSGVVYNAMTKHLDQHDGYYDVAIDVIEDIQFTEGE